ncbi:hypothetical protein ACFXKD_28485 [Nocardiopsis aegyptia]|uniref:hypothetical protein n=1 Tax=Nocardiopsis aegyptia TaxID=220378 RepID=UPI00366AA176
MNTTKTAAMAALGLSALLLTACSGGQGNVFEFQAEPIEPASGITIRIPDDLREALGSQADGILVDSVDVTPHDLDGLEYCGVDLAVDFADGGLDALAVETTASTREPVFTEEEADELAERFTDDSEGLAAELDARGINLYESATPYAKENLEQHARNTDNVDTEELAYLLREEISVDGERTVPGWENLAGDLVDVDDIAQIADLDESDPRPGAYVHDDMETITVVTDCAASANDEDATVPFVFPETGEDDVYAFAETPITVMSDGTLGVTGTIDGFQRDANGNWITA